jgi:peptidyl-tRNA hydrolase, PTH1 family
VNHSIELLVGLGNPGARYAGTRHNAGEELVSLFCQQHEIELRSDARFYGRVGETLYGGKKLRVLLPDTFMNRSGQSVAALVNFYKIDPNQVLVVYDELDLEPGVARFKFDGGAGGHNGIKDIISNLGNQRDFYRLRIGIGHPGNASLVSNYVLSKAPAEEREKTVDSITSALHNLPHALGGNWEKAMYQLHTKDA